MGMSMVEYWPLIVNAVMKLLYYLRQSWCVISNWHSVFHQQVFSMEEGKKIKASVQPAPIKSLV